MSKNNLNLVGWARKRALNMQFGVAECKYDFCLSGVVPFFAYPPAFGAMVRPFGYAPTATGLLAPTISYPNSATPQFKCVTAYLIFQQQIPKTIQVVEKQVQK